LVTDLTGAGSGVVDNAGTMTVEDKTYGSKFYPAYWNPQNDPATWQHMQTYAIGFGTAPTGAGQLFAAPTTAVKSDKTNATVCDPTLKTIPNPSYSYTQLFTKSNLCSSVGLTPGVAMPAFDSQFGNFFTGYASGTYQWPYTLGWGDDTYMAADLANGVEAVLDLPHASYNGRGKYFPATSTTAVADAFSSILRTAITQSAGTVGAGSAGGSSTRVSSGTMVYASGYAFDSTKTNVIHGWSGWLKAYTGNGLTEAPVWSASTPAAASRNIFTVGPGGVATGAPATCAGGSCPATGGMAFTTAALNGDPSGINSASVNAVRALPLGDIVNSQLTFVGKTTLISLNADYLKFASAVNGFRASMGTVYVGANDGMLHGFNAGAGSPASPGTGAERFAYVPRGLLDKLSAFADLGSYTHRYWVDGSTFSGDAQLGTTSYGIGTSSTTNPGIGPRCWWARWARAAKATLRWM